MNDNRESRLKVPYYPGLDGLRALAVIAVIVYHANHSWLGAGFLGVEVFFVISGYLITLLLIAERERNGFISLKDFWLRRAKRLLPALWTMLIGVILYTSLFNHDEVGALRGDVIAGGTYVSNWFQIVTGTSYFSTNAFVPLRHLWSLAVEEQFYLIWPLVMFLVLKSGRKFLPKVGLWMVGFAGAIAVFTGVFYKSGPITDQNGDRVPSQFFSLFGRTVSRLDFLYLGSISRFSGILLGAALAMFWRPWTLARSEARNAGPKFDFVGAVGIAILVLVMWKFRLVVEGTRQGTLGYDLMFRGGFLLVGIASVMAIAAVTHPSSLLGRVVVGNPLLVYLGQRSYGLYLYHWPIFQIYRKIAGKALTTTQFVVLISLALIVTELSYRFIETPVRKGQIGTIWRTLRKNLNADEQTRKIGLVVASIFAVAFLYSGVSLATAEVKKTGVEASIEEAKDSITNVGPTSTLAGQTTTTIPGQTTSTNPEGVIPMLAIGDSVMAGAAKQLADLGYTVDAKVNRQLLGGVEIVTYLKAINRLGRVVVLHLGTNDEIDQETLDAFMAPLSKVDLVVVLTIHVPDRGWQEPNNALIRALPAKYSNVKILDWYQIAEDAKGGLSSDGVHLGEEMKKVYADAINKMVTLTLLATDNTTTTSGVKSTTTTTAS